MGRRKKKHAIKRTVKWSLVALLICVVTFFSIRYFTSQEPEAISLRELPVGFHSHGMDISHYQNEIDWDILNESLDSTVSFVYYKVTEGISFVDPLWKSHRMHLEENGVKNGAYHFFSPRLDASLQVEHFLNNYISSENSLPPVLDAETKGTSDEDLIRRMKLWLVKVESLTGVRPIIYTSYHFYKTKFRDKFDGYHFWIASYNKNERRLKDDCIIHWQYTDRGKIPGIEGFVDLNFSKNRY